ncbi:hypothetical protein B566_EDAN019554, partial [Ephemera danica]
RYQAVKINDKLSTFCLVKSGIPQGSCCGPLFFLIFIDELTKLVQNCEICLFADDCKIFYCYDKLDSLILLQEDLDREIVHKTSKSINIMLRSFKTKSISFLVKMYKTFIRPILDYNSICYSPKSKKLIDLMEGVQKYFLRRITNYECGSYNQKLLNIKIDSLRIRRLKFDLIFAYKSKIPKIQINDKIIIDDYELATLFNNHFSDIFVDDNNDEMNFINDDNIKCILNVIDFDVSDIFEILNNLEPKTSCGPDSLPQIIFKKCSTSLSLPLFLIFKEILSNGVNPKLWKQSIVS